MEHPNKGFLDDTSLSKTPRPPLKTSTVMKPNANRSENLFAKRVVSHRMDASFIPRDDQTFQALSEVTNIPHFVFPKPKFSVASESSFITDANSSLGILQMDNISDIADFSLPISTPINGAGESRRKIRESQMDVLLENDVESSLKESDSGVQSTEENNGNSSSDIQYDGTNIPELNFDYDALPVFTSPALSESRNAISEPVLSVEGKEALDSLGAQVNRNSSTNLAEKSVQNIGAASSNVERNVNRESIFEGFEPSYDSIFKKLLPNMCTADDDKVLQLSQVMKACPFLDSDSRELASILQNQSSAEQDFLNNLEKLGFENSSLKFSPDEMTARSTSFKSSTVVNASESNGSSGHEALFGAVHQSRNHSMDEGLKDVVLKDSLLVGDKAKYSNSPNSTNDEGGNNIADSFECCGEKNTFVLSEKGSPLHDALCDKTYQSELNYKDSSQFVTASGIDQYQLEISDSEFMPADEALELFKEEGRKFKIGRNSNESVASSFSPPKELEITAPSWFLELNTSARQNSGHHVSIGTLISARTENLGRLSQDSKRERPFFGTTVNTPNRKISEESSVFSESAESVYAGSVDEQPTSDKDISGNPTTPSAVSESNFNYTDFQTERSALRSVLDGDYQKSSETEILRDSVLSRFLADISSKHPRDLASELFQRCAPSNKAHSMKSNQKIRSMERTNTTKFSTSTICGDESKTADSSSMTPVARPGRKLRKPTATREQYSSLSISSTESCSSKIDEKDSKGCSNCLCQQQKVPCSNMRPPSACSSTCSNAGHFQNGFQAPHGCVKYFHSQEQHYPNLIPSNGSLNQLGNFFQYRNPYSQDVLPTQPLSIGIPQSISQGPLSGCVSLPFPMHGGAPYSYPAVQGPAELRFPEKLSVGSSQCIALTIQNIHNMQYFYHISYISAYVNEEPVSIEMAGVHFPYMFPRSSGNTTDIQITLSPKYEGKIVVTLQVAACFNPVELTMTTIDNSSIKTKIQYESVRPCISISSDGKENLDIGSVIAGSTVVKYIRISNKCDATIPLHLSLSNDLKGNRISFGLNLMKRQNFSSTSGWKMLSPKAMLYRLPCSTSETSFLDVPVIFEAGNGNSDVNFTLTAAVHTSTFSEPLGFLRISATVGVAELVLCDTTQSRLLLSAETGSVYHQSLIVKNQCSFPIVYDLIVVDDDTNSFTVSPASLNLQSMQSMAITVTFSPMSTLVVKGTLQVAAQPHDKVFSVAELIGNGKESVPNPKIPRNLFSNVISKQPPREESKSITHNSSNLIECNKKYLSWGGVDIGNSVIKTFSIRNSSNKSLQAKLSIKEKSQISFRLVDDKNEQSTSLILGLTSKEQKSISVVYSPTRIAPSSGSLLIKPIVENGQKTFSMPLVGYGGTGKLKVAEVSEREGMGHCLDIVVSRERRTVFSNLTVHNVGFRPIFVKIVISTGGYENTSKEQIVINPTEFVLLENENKNLIASCTIENFSTFNTAACGIITLLYGDEIIRQQMRRASTENTRYCQSSMYHGINFGVPFAGEERVPHDDTYFNKINIFSLFSSTMKKYLIHLNIVEQSPNYSQMTFGALSMLDNTYCNMTSNSTPFRRLTAGSRYEFSPPVKEFTVDTLNRLSMPNSPIFHRDLSFLAPKTDENLPVKDNLLEGWTVKPEILTIDTSSKDNRILLINLSKQDLKFKVECAIDVISISPVSGIVCTKGQIGLRISIIPYSYGKLWEDYKGYIKVICGGSEKSVLVKVIKDQKKSKDSLNCSENNATLEQDAELEASNADKTLICSDPSIFIKSISDFPKEIILKSTAPGKISETTLTVQNVENHSIDWDIHPISMLFTESLEDSLNCINVLQIIPSAGTLEAMEKANIVIKFVPLKPDSFSRFFELSLCYNGQKQNCNFKISGCSFFLTESNELTMSSDAAPRSKKKLKAGIYVENETYEFPSTEAGQSSTVYITMKNPSQQDVKLNIIKPRLPFTVQQSSVLVRSKKFLKVPVSFKPKTAKAYEDILVLHSEDGHEFMIKLKGVCK